MLLLGSGRQLGDRRYLEGRTKVKNGSKLRRQT
jgi:hypothetical protein